jgi:hypothetical protein
MSEYCAICDVHYDSKLEHVIRAREHLTAVQAAEREVIEAAEALVEKDGFFPERDSEAEPMWRLKDVVAKLREVRGK